MYSQWISRARRSFLQSLVTLGGATAAVSLPPAVLTSQAQGRSTPDGHPFLPWYTRTQNYRSLKQSSYDKTGGNDDSWPIGPGKVQEVFNQKGPGIVTHLWFTIAAQSRDYLKELVFRAWWDEEDYPSVESPVGDFFGLNLGENFIYQSIFLNCSSVKALNCYLPMP